MPMPSDSPISPTKPIISFDEPSHPRRQPTSNAVSTSSSPRTSSRALSFSATTSTTSVSLPEQLPSNTWSRATSFSGEFPHQSRTHSPLALSRAISFETPGDHLEGSSRWNKEKEERLNMVETKCREFQRRWSEEQHKYVGEVEALHEARSHFKKFTRRRSKDHKREGLRVIASHELPFPTDDGSETGQDAINAGPTSKNKEGDHGKKVGVISSSCVVVGVNGEDGRGSGRNLVALDVDEVPVIDI